MTGAPAPFPAILDLSGRKVLVVGGGAVAARKVASLVDSGAVVTVVAPDVCDEIASLGGITVEQRLYAPGEAAGYRLVVTATGDAQVNRAVFADGEAANVFVNAADDPASCSFTLPAVLRHDPVVVAVSTGGSSPALAGWIRDLVAASVGPEFAVVARLLSEARQSLHAAGLSTEDVDWMGILRSDVLSLVREGKIDDARQQIASAVRVASTPDGSEQDDGVHQEV